MEIIIFMLQPVLYLRGKMLPSLLFLDAQLCVLTSLMRRSVIAIFCFSGGGGEGEDLRYINIGFV